LEGTAQGWVTTLIHSIKIRLAQKLGRSDAFDLWMDQRLASNVKITSQISAALDQTAILIVVLSPGYIASEWCRREKGLFLKHIRERENSRIFIIERDKIDDSERPDEFNDLKGIRFWIWNEINNTFRILGEPQPDPKDNKYYSQIDCVSSELVSELRRLKESAVSPVSPEPIQAHESSGNTVFLAQVTDDIDQERHNVQCYLMQMGINVLPVTWYSQEPAAFTESVQRDLAQSHIFVQLLSAVPGKKPPDLPQGYINLQIELAKQASLPILQWRSPNLDPASVTDETHRAILEGENVWAENLEEFKREILKRTQEKPKEQVKQHINAFIFVDMEIVDRQMAEHVCETLDQYGVDYSLPIQSKDPENIRKNMEQNLLYCDAIIIIYGASNVCWVQSQLFQFRKILAMRKEPLQAFAVFEGPPAEKESLNMKLQNLQIIDCRKGSDEEQLDAFVNRLADVQ